MDRTEIKAHAAVKLIAPIDQAELAVRIAEAIIGVQRPPGTPARKVLACLDPETREMLKTASAAAMEYFKECILAAQEPS